jgi:hypothetical protein
MEWEQEHKEFCGQHSEDFLRRGSREHREAAYDAEELIPEKRSIPINEAWYSYFHKSFMCRDMFLWVMRHTRYCVQSSSAREKPNSAEVERCMKQYEELKDWRKKTRPCCLRLPRESTVDRDEFIWMNVPGAIVGISRENCGCHNCIMAHEGKRPWYYDRDHDFLVSYYRPKLNDPHDFGRNSNRMEFELREEYLTRDEMRLLLTGGAIEVLEEAVKYGCFVPPREWVRSHFDRQVTIKAIRAVRRHGALYKGKGVDGKSYPLTQLWLGCAVDSSGIALPGEIGVEVEKNSSAGIYRWINIPAGAKDCRSFAYTLAYPREKLPYPQAVGTHTCYASAIANTLAFVALTEADSNQRLALEKASQIINEKGLAIGSPPDVRRKVPQMAGPVLKRAGFKLRKIEAIGEVPLFDDTSERPIVAEVQGVNNYPHCVGFLRGWIVDPTEPWLLKRTESNLDAICKGFVALKWAVEIVAREP